jgi:hypothetical protein
MSLREDCFFNMPPRSTILTLLLLVLATSCQKQSAEAPPARPAAVSKAAVQNPAASAPGRPVFPYSVVSGGITTPSEMASAMKSDAVVGSHYAGLEPASFRPTVLKEDQKGYVSYRIRDKVYWSRRLMTLKKGELVLTDGESMLRGRCGNRVSPVAMSPVAPADQEPTEAVLNSWQDSKALAAIPPVPAASPVKGALALDRSAPVDPSTGTLLLPPGGENGPFITWPNAVGPGGFWVGGGSPGGGGIGPGGGIGGFGGGPTGGPNGTPPSGGETPPFGLPPTVPPSVAVVPPTVIPSGPPRLELPLPPETIAAIPPTSKPPVIEPPNGAWPPTAGFPPMSIPPVSQPPGVVPPATPPTAPPPSVPPGTGEPPRSTPPSAFDPPPGFPPPGDPPGPPEVDNPVPEPATMLLAASALALLGAGRYFANRRRR